MPRVVSFLPAGTEIAYALGAGQDLVGRSHECDYPAEVKHLPVVSKPALALDGLSQDEIDRAVKERLGSGESLYVVDERLLDALAPDVILTQDLCQVCAPSGNELTRAVASLASKPELVWLSPQNMAGVDENILMVGRAVGRVREAVAVVAANHARLDRVRAAVAGVTPRRIAFLEWTEPLFCAGHWVPEMIEIAGGRDPMGVSGGDSVRMTWDDVRAGSPEMIVVAPCGYGLAQAIELAAKVPPISGARIVAVDANAYFARPGPRLAEGVELMASLFHPGRFSWPHAHRPWAEVSPAAISA